MVSDTTPLGRLLIWVWARFLQFFLASEGLESAGAWFCSLINIASPKIRG
jgi:hypothetical protein